MPSFFLTDNHITGVGVSIGASEIEFGCFHGAPPAGSHDALGDALVIILIDVDGVDFAIIIVFDHGGSYGILQDNFPIFRTEVADHLIGSYLIDLIKRFPIAEESGEISNFFLKFSDSIIFLFKFIPKYLNLSFSLLLGCFFYTSYLCLEDLDQRFFLLLVCVVNVI